MKKTEEYGNYYYAAILFAILLLAACQPNVMFQEAVPPGIKAIKKIPNHFQGVYLCESDSSLIYTDANVVYKESYHMFITPISRVRQSEECKIVAGGLYLPGRKECIPFEYVGKDSIQAKVYSIDTLFNFRDNEVMKLYKGRLFMNYINEYKEWVTFMISPMGEGYMKWEMIDVPDQVKKVEDITAEYKTRLNKDDETMYIIKPTLVEFDKILENDYTVLCDVLIPVY